MYESHFGFSGAPFQLNPDPSFYFDSRGHASALAYLKFGVYQGEGFIVVTGDIGAGKTTLVRTLLGGLDRQQVVAAQVVSTQLESGDLLRAICTAFGIAPAGKTKAELIAGLEAFLTAVAASGRRALLVVDEAQNLSLEAIEELRMLSNFQLEQHALLQSFLVGQPELRKLLESRSMEQFRQRVIASCHLGPLDLAETRAYIEHRLKRVGWQDKPVFDDAAFEEIHRWTGGIPRRINLLCNRLLLGAYLDNTDEVSATLVMQTAREMRGEVGESAFVAAVSNPGTLGQDPPESAAAAVADPVGESGVLATPMSTAVRRVHVAGMPVSRPLLCLVDSPASYMKACAFASESARQPGLPPVVALNAGGEDELTLPGELGSVLPRPALDIHLDIRPGRYAVRAAAVLEAFDALLQELQPSAVIAMGGDDAVLTCALAAHKAGLPLVRVDAGKRSGDGSADSNAILLDRLAGALYTNELTTHYTLYREGIPAERVHCFGNLMVNTLHLTAPMATQPEATLKREGSSTRSLRAEDGYVLVTLQFDPESTRVEILSDLVSGFVAMPPDLRVIWPMQEETRFALERVGLGRWIKNSKIDAIADVGYLEALGLLQRASCLLCGSDGALAEEGLALTIPVVRLIAGATAAEAAVPGVVREVERALALVGEAVTRGRMPLEEPGYWDGGPAARMAQHLSEWLWREGASIGARVGQGGSVLR
ncbi:XrtA-associated ATPase [Aquabacterium sp. A7-Y]|uniref:XrtA/PEP-CTERM system-associated ATPase n=1 Tax=Aquabacterium sp. A7-Y TaxID=1349605 RepID=UPI00223E0CAC|nr:XrtA/PEP-CTERM system-associated ATPase [Aquabacterium sp. A7-Y]MCW7537524.1 XrtA-associated ATPase [Aquabacterium sp. A7-Y]